MMRKKIILASVLCLILVSFSGCISDSGSDNSKETTPSIDCKSDYTYKPSGFLPIEDFDKISQDRTVIWYVIKVEDGPVKWEECSWQLINKAGSKNDEDATVEYTDRDNDGKISKDDYFIVTPLVRGNYSFKIIFQSTEEYAFTSPFKFYSSLSTMPEVVDPPTLSLAQDSALEINGTWVNFTVHSASANANWSDMRVIIDSDLGGGLNLSTPTSTEAPIAGSCGYTGNSDLIKAGDSLYCHSNTTLISGDMLEIIHIPSNSVILFKTIT